MRALADVLTEKKAFEAEYIGKPGTNPNIMGWGISKVGIMDPTAQDEQKDDYCIIVLLRVAIPEGQSPFPAEYKGVKVFTKVVGEIKLQ